MHDVLLRLFKKGMSVCRVDVGYSISIPVIGIVIPPFLTDVLSRGLSRIDQLSRRYTANSRIWVMLGFEMAAG